MGFTVRPFNFVEFLREVPDADQNRGGGGGSPARRFLASEVVVDIGEMMGEHQGVHVHPWDSLAWPKAGLGGATMVAAARQPVRMGSGSISLGQ